MPKVPAEQSIQSWFYNTYYQYKDRVPRENIHFKYAKALIDVAGADGILTEAERRWVLTYAATLGVKHEEIDQLRDYKVGSEDSLNIFDSTTELKSAEHFQNQLIYDGFRAAAADGPLKQREIDAITNVAKKIGIKEEKIQEILQFYKDEEEFRQKKDSTLFPKTYAEAIKAIDKHYGR